MAKRVLITGASIAGCTTAWWLARLGFNVTVIERASSFRDGGQNIDIRGVGRDVLRKMGLEDAAWSHGTGEKGTAWVRDDGSIAAKFLTADTGADGPTAEMEILRGDLARLLYDAVRPRVDFRFSEYIQEVSQTSSGAHVIFSSGEIEEFDIVIIAEGVGSSTRSLVFHGEPRSRWMDMMIGYFTIPRTPSDDQLWRWCHFPGGRSVSLRPDNHGTTRAMLILRRPSDGGDKLVGDQQKEFLRKEFSGLGWETSRVLNALPDTNDFYFDILRQIKIARWCLNRVALVGDAAWCVTPLGGIGATLAVTGTYVLANEIASAAADSANHFGAYEARMRPFVQKSQHIPKIVPRLMNPSSKTGVQVLHGTLRLMSTPFCSKLINTLFSRNQNKFKLPDYGYRSQTTS